MSLAHLAQARLVRYTADVLDEIWIFAALLSVAEGRQRDPPLDALRRLTQPAEAWADIPASPGEALELRVGRMMDSQHLAIALGDSAWLEQLERAWAMASRDIECSRLRALGELSLARGGPGWTPDEIELLTEDSYLLDEFPAERAWRSLAEGDMGAARAALGEREAWLAAERRTWEADPERGISWIVTHPGSALGVEARALRALLASQP